MSDYYDEGPQVTAAPPPCYLITQAQRNTVVGLIEDYLRELADEPRRNIQEMAKVIELLDELEALKPSGR
jgi:hypothetical protein